MSEEERLEYKEELSCYSKEEMIEKYIDEVEENEILTNQWYKSTQKIKKAIEYIKEHKDNEYRNGRDDEYYLELNEKELEELLEILGDKECLLE